MHELFVAIQQWPLAVWAREDGYAYFVALIFHAWGTAFLAGGGVLIALRALGVGQATVLARFRGFLPALWVGAALALPSGLLLLLAYPAKALTNPVFGIKMACLAVAVLLVRRLLQDVPPPRRLAALCLALWLVTVVAGKLLLHTYRVLLVS